jgi:hypothetical protein
MGKILNCHCDNCKYSRKELYLGSGMRRGKSHFPAFDAQSKTVVQIDTSDLVQLIDLKELRINKEELNRLQEEGKIPYFVKTMFKKPLFSGRPISEAPLYLQSKSNLCPKCNRYKLEFEFVGLFD